MDRHTIIKSSLKVFIQKVLSSFMTYHRVCNYSNTTGATSKTGNAYPSGAPAFILGYYWVSCWSL